jgi:hypothetical protein
MTDKDTAPDESEEIHPPSSSRDPIHDPNSIHVYANDDLVEVLKDIDASRPIILWRNKR